MCGIVALLSPREPLGLSTLVDMTRRLRHRGPDDEGYLADDGHGVRLFWGPDTPQEVRSTPTASRPQADAGASSDVLLRVGLGHRRLAIVDLSAQGHQPMRRGDLSIVFNGEIYDHVELRAQLEALGHRFESHSDTEVLIAAWRQWGEDAFRRINGMWALVLHDRARRRLVIARDRYGVKPVYWWQGAGGELAIASEVKALLAHPRIAARVDRQACTRWLRAGPESWRDETLLEGIRSLPAGHWAEVSTDHPELLRPRAYWNVAEIDAGELAAPFDPAIAERYAEEYRALLGDAVRLRMRMDVRFGTALSGGLDSSQIATLVNDEMRRRGTLERQEVFSSVYRGEASPGDRAYAAAVQVADESGPIASAVRRLDVRSNLIEPHWRDVPTEHEHMIWALDLPPVNTLMSSWHTYALIARRGVVVSLDGQGADEQLGGYIYYARNLVAHAPLRTALSEAAALWKRVPGIRPMVATGAAALLLRSVVGRRGLRAIATPLGARTLGLDFAQALRDDFTTHLQTLLFYADKSSMAWSIESRMPFMDWRLVEFLSRLPLSLRIHDGWTKWLARHAMRDRLPDDIVWRRDKLGWAIPEVAWFGPGAPLRTWCDERIAASRLACETAAASGVDPRSADLSTRLRLLNLAVWSRLYIDEPGRPGRTLGRGRRLGEG